MKRAAAVVGLALMLASACSDGNGASPTLTPLPATPTLTATASPTQTPSPTSSAALRAFPDTPQGAADFARYVYAEITHAYSSKDPTTLNALFEPDCKACANFTDTVEQLRTGDLTFTGGTATILSAETPGGQTGLVTVSVRSDYAGITFKDASGRVVGSEPAGELQNDVTLRRVADSYKVTEITSSKQ